MNPSFTQLTMACERGIPVVLGADAHRPTRAGADYAEALDLVADAGYTEVSHFLDRNRHTTPIETARASLESAAIA